MARVGDSLAVVDINNRSTYLLDAADKVIVTLSSDAGDLSLPTMVTSNGIDIMMSDIRYNMLSHYILDDGTLRLRSQLKGSGPELVNSLFERIGGIAMGGIR